MSIRNKHALQAAVSSLVILTSIFLYFILTHQQPVSAALLVLPIIILTFIFTLSYWWVVFPFAQFRPMRAIWGGILLVMIVLLLPLLFWYGGNDKGPLVNGGSVTALLIIFFWAIFTPVSIAASFLIHWIQTRKTAVAKPAKADKSFLRFMATGGVHLIAFVLVVFAARETLFFLTNDYVGQRHQLTISKIGYSLNSSIKDYFKRTGAYPKSLPALSPSREKDFVLYRRWGAFGYQTHGSSGYSLLWRYSLSQGIICSSDIRFWPQGSKRTETMAPPVPNSHGCYAVNPEVIRHPPWLQ